MDSFSLFGMYYLPAPAQALHCTSHCSICCVLKTLQLADIAE